jgi:hypothetical protein
MEVNGKSVRSLLSRSSVAFRLLSGIEFPWMQIEYDRTAGGIAFPEQKSAAEVGQKPEISSSAARETFSSDIDAGKRYFGKAFRDGIRREGCAGKPVLRME